VPSAHPDGGPGHAGAVPHAVHARRLDRHRVPAAGAELGVDVTLRQADTEIL